MADTPLISFRLQKEYRDKFQKLFPYCLSRFLKRCILRALSDRNFFNEVYFNEV